MATEPKGKTKPVLKTILKLRQDAVGMMSTQLNGIFRSIESHINATKSSNILAYHAIGTLVNQLQDEPDRYIGTDGRSGLQLVKAALSTEKSTLTKAAQFARMYSDAELQIMVGLANESTGWKLQWKHVIYLITVPTTSQRRAFENEAIKKMLDPATLSTMILRKNGQTGSGGRPFKQEISLWAQLAQMIKLSENFLSRYEKIWDGEEKSVFGDILALEDAAELEVEHATTLAEIASIMAAISGVSATGSRRALEASQKVQGMIEQRDAEIARLNAQDQGSETLRPVEA